MCGVPQPRLEGEFNGQDITPTHATLNNYTHNFTLQLPRLTQAECGKVLKIKAVGHNGTLNATARIFVENCEYFCYYRLTSIPLWHHFKLIFSVKFLYCKKIVW